MYELEKTGDRIAALVLRALPPVPSHYTGPEVVARRKGEFEKKPLELAGRACFNKWEYVEDPDDDGEDASSTLLSTPRDKSKEKANPANDEKTDKKKQRSGALLKLSDTLEGKDLYKLLGVSPDCNLEELRKAFRAKSLECHPDKHAGKADHLQKEIQEHFVNITEANTILMDTALRRKYDSTLPFDDSVPSKTKAQDCETFEEFYALFEPVFKRNAKWSTKKAPLLPNGDATLDQVQAFYKFWFSFDSWRCMDQKILEEEGDEAFCDLKDAECREEKRWMERENMRIRKKYLSEEHGRIRQLVDNAEKNDPRIIAAKEEQFNKKNKAKIEREQAIQEAKEQAEREKAEAERKAKEEEELKQLEKRKKEEAKNAVKKNRQAVRALVNQHTRNDPEQVQELILSWDPDELQAKLDMLNNVKTSLLQDEFSSLLKDFGIEPRLVEKKVVAPPKEEVIDPKVLKRQEEQRKKEEKKRLEEEKANALAKKEKERKRQEELKKRDEEQAKKDAIKAEREKKDAAEKAKRAAEAKAAANLKLEAEKEKQREIARAQQAAAAAEKEEGFRCDRYNMNRTMLLDRYADGFAEVKKLATAEEQKDLLSYAMNVLDDESRLDVACAMLATRKDRDQMFETFFLGKRPLDPDHQYYVADVSTVVRNKMKKVRQQIRKEVENAMKDVKEATVPDEFKAMVDCQLPLEGWEVPPPKAAEQPAAAGGKKKGKKGGAGAADKEDLDALLQEFGVANDGGGGGGKKKGNKKK